MEPAYIKTYREGRLAKRVDRAREILLSCRLCPQGCGVDRQAGERGVCRTGDRAVVASVDPHFGEERPLVGTSGSGTIFFSGCNLLCRFCQNYDISHGMAGSEWSAHDLATAMLSLQRMGCHNVNFVTPSHVVPQILMALERAVPEGLRIPLVYNSGGYDEVETLKLLEGIVDIYMPDFKFWDPAVAERFCKAPDYPEKTAAAIREMHRQVGDLQINDAGIAERGLLIRHLVLPEGLAGTREIMRFLSTRISPNSYVNVMAQYRPCGGVGQDPVMGRTLRDDEYAAAMTAARQEGISRLDQRRRTFRIEW